MLDILCDTLSILTSNVSGKKKIKIQEHKMPEQLNLNINYVYL